MHGDDSRPTSAPSKCCFACALERSGAVYRQQARPSECSGKHELNRIHLPSPLPSKFTCAQPCIWLGRHVVDTVRLGTAARPGKLGSRRFVYAPRGNYFHHDRVMLSPCVCVLNDRCPVAGARCFCVATARTLGRTALAVRSLPGLTSEVKAATDSPICRNCDSQKATLSYALIAN